ncbi:exonuclease 1 isoform X2 [Zootermopsis nevadensis]|nr:exonuclease 1 isoform X2 [Zootermopsis nevadensis]
MKLVNMLLSHNIKPILVFDGQHLPAKAGTERKRHESRQSSRKRAAELLRAGQRDEARNFLKRCIDITHNMALALIHECRRRNVDCIVAPYEADAQLAYLNLKNIAQIVITEDSDLVLFGCRKVLFKMDVAGNGLLVEHERLHLAMGIRPENFSSDKFRYMCILSGCDYLPSLPGIGLFKACKFITRTLDTDIHRALSRLPGHLNMKSLTVSDEYRNEFLLADAAFKYQLVFDPLSRRLTRLNEPLEPEKVTDYAGKMVPDDTAYQLALGNLDPFTLQKVGDFNPDAVKPTQNVKTCSWNQIPVAPHISIWSQDYKIPTMGLKQDPRQVDRQSTKGKVLRKQVSLITQSKRQHEDVSDFCSDADLTAIYLSQSVQGQFSKRRRSDSCELDETEVEKANSPDNTPMKQDAAVTETHASLEGALEMTPLEQSSPNKLTSPVLMTGKNKRNPFLKQIHPDSPRKDLTGFSSSLYAVEGTQEQKFGAIGKFDRYRWSKTDNTTVVQSRYFSKQNNSNKKGVTEATDKKCEQPLKMIAKLQNLSNMLDKCEGTGSLDIESYIADSPSNEIQVKCDAAKGPESCKTTNAISVLTMLEVTGRKQSNDNLTNERSLVEHHKSHSSQIIKSCSGNSIQALPSGKKSISKSFSWSDNRFGFQKSESVTSLMRSDAVIKDFKNPFRKTDSCHKENFLVTETVKASPSLQSPLPIEKEEDLVDDQNLVDSGLELGPVTSCHQPATSLTVTVDSMTVDEGFHSPSSPVLNQSQSLGFKSKDVVRYRPHLKKSNGKQQTLLSMFAFRKKPKLQHM